MGFSSFFWLLVWAFVFACYLIVLFQIVSDLFRDRDLSGWWKAIWIVFLIIAPFLSALIYVIARGRVWPSGTRLRWVVVATLTPMCRRRSSACPIQLIRLRQRRSCWIRVRSTRLSLIS